MDGSRPWRRRRVRKRDISWVGVGVGEGKSIQVYGDCYIRHMAGTP
jgi:hypothetical protein